MVVPPRGSRPRPNLAPNGGASAKYPRTMSEQDTTYDPDRRNSGPSGHHEPLAEDLARVEERLNEIAACDHEVTKWMPGIETEGIASALICDDCGHIVALGADADEQREEADYVWSLIEGDYVENTEA